MCAAGNYLIDRCGADPATRARAGHARDPTARLALRAAAHMTRKSRTRSNFLLKCFRGQAAGSSVCSSRNEAVRCRF